MNSSKHWVSSDKLNWWGWNRNPARSNHYTQRHLKILKTPKEVQDVKRNKRYTKISKKYKDIQGNPKDPQRYSKYSKTSKATPEKPRALKILWEICNYLSCSMSKSAFPDVADVFFVGEVDGMNLNGLLVCGLLTSSNWERLNGGLMSRMEARLFVGSSINGVFLIKRPKLSLGWS